jgi:predicted phage terminase large subunit-like protein
LGKVLGYDFQDDVHGDLFQTLKPGEKPNRLILWPRGHFKTSAVVVDIVQSVLNDENTRLMLMQATLKLTKGWVHEVASHFTGRNPNSKLIQLFPDYEKISGDAMGFTVKARTRTHLKEHTITAASPKAVSTGQHYRALYADDLVNTGNFRNIELLDKLENEFYHFLPLIDPGGLVTVTGTRYSFADLYQRIIDKNKQQKDWEISIRECYKADGSLLFPERITKDERTIGFTEELLARYQAKDPEFFAPQYLNKILVGASQLFTEEQMMGAVRHTLNNPEYPAASPSIMYIDLSEGKTESDNGVLAIGKKDARNRVWIQDCIAGKFPSAQFADMVIALYLKYRPQSILVEKQPGAGWFVDYVRTVTKQRGMYLPIDVDKTPKQKQKGAKHIRISALPGPIRRKELFFCAGISDFDDFVKEFTQYPRGRYDDRPDCIAMLYQTLTANAQMIPATLNAAGMPSKLPWFFNTPDAQPKQKEDSPLGGFLLG